MQRGATTALAGVVFVLVALLAAFMTEAFIADTSRGDAVATRSGNVTLVGAGTTSDGNIDVSSDIDDSSDEQIAELVELERSAIAEVAALTRHSPTFRYTLAAKIALLVSLGLFWVAARVLGRPVRRLNGNSLTRIQSEDMAGFGIAVGVAAGIVGVGAIGVAAIRYGSTFAGFYARTYSVVAAVVLVSSIVVVTLASHLAMPANQVVALRRIPVRGMLRATRAARIAAFALAIMSVGPALAALPTSVPTASSAADSPATNSSGADSSAVPTRGAGAQPIAATSASIAKPASMAQPRRVFALDTEEEVLARYVRYELWIATVGVGGLLVALLLSSWVGAYLTAVAGAHRDFTARLNGADWFRLGIGASRVDIAMMAAVTAVLLVFSHLSPAHASAAGVLLVTAIGAGLIAQGLARRRVFARVVERRL